MLTLGRKGEREFEKFPAYFQHQKGCTARDSLLDMHIFGLADDLLFDFVY